MKITKKLDEYKINVAPLQILKQLQKMRLDTDPDIGVSWRYRQEYLFIYLILPLF